MQTRTPRSTARRRAPLILVSSLALAGLAAAGAAPVSAAPATGNLARLGPPIAVMPPLGHAGPGRHHGGSPLAKAIDEASEDVVEAGAVGHLAYVDDGRHLTMLANGLADRATGRALRADDQFEIASNTKTFMAVLTLQSVGRGELALDDTVETLLPGALPNGDSITLRMLLNHTSGLFNYLNDPSWYLAAFADPTRMWTPAELVAVATDHGPEFAPGEGWSYSNTNYILVGEILKRATGRPLADLLQEQIARPLGLRHTLLVTTTAPNTGPGYAHGYVASFAATPTTYMDVSGAALGGWAGAAGAILSTTPDLARFISALIRGRILPPHLLAEMLGTVPADGTDEYGLGIRKTVTPCGTVWGHGGDTPGHHSNVRVSLDGRRVAITDTTTQPSKIDGGNLGAGNLTAAYKRAELVSICAMYGRTPPA